jgi:hypothetical protein
MQFDYPVSPPGGRVGGFGGHNCTGGATGAGFGLLHFDWWAVLSHRPLSFRGGPGSPCRYFFPSAVLRLQQTAKVGSR